MEAYISEYRTKFLPWRGGRYARQGLELCLGSKKDTQRFAEDGARCLPWGTEPDEKNRKKIRALRLVPNQRQLPSAELPAFVSKAPKLDFISMPISVVPKLKAGALPPSLSSVMLVNSAGCYELVKASKAGWPDFALESLRALQFIDVAGSKPVTSLLGISEEQLPSLRLLEFDLRGSAKKLETVSGFKTLEFLALGHVGDRDVFEFVCSPLRAQVQVSLPQNSQRGSRGHAPYVRHPRRAR